MKLDKFKTNPFAKSYKSDLTEHVEGFREVFKYLATSENTNADYKHTGFPVMFFSKVSYVLFFLAVGMIIGSLIIK